MSASLPPKEEDSISEESYLKESKPEADEPAEPKKPIIQKFLPTKIERIR
jgi:hypothetical protein